MGVMSALGAELHRVRLALARVSRGARGERETNDERGGTAAGERASAARAQPSDLSTHDFKVIMVTVERSPAHTLRASSAWPRRDVASERALHRVRALRVKVSLRDRAGMHERPRHAEASRGRNSLTHPHIRATAPQSVYRLR